MTAHRVSWADEHSMRRLCSCGWAGDWKDFDAHLPEEPSLFACLSVVVAIALGGLLLGAGFWWMSIQAAEYRAEHAAVQCQVSS